MCSKRLVRLIFDYSRGYKQRGRRFLYGPPDDDRNLLEEKATNCAIKNLSDDPTEKVTKVNDSKLVQANVDVNIVAKVERHPVRVPKRTEYSRSLKDRDTFKCIIARYEQRVLPVVAYVRDDLSPKQLQLDNRLRDKCSGWNMKLDGRVS